MNLWINFLFAHFCFCQFGTNYSGYITTNETRGHYLSYWAFESQGSIKDPVVLWMNGGPGASSIFLGLLNENGPFVVDLPALGLHANPYSWNTVANVIWLDQPVGVGFSYSDTPGDKDNIHTELMMLEVDTFLRLFLTKYPQFNQGQEFYIFAESYGGHYGPSLSNKILTGNQNGKKPKINLKGLGLGNAWVNPLPQTQAYITFSTANGLIGSVTKEFLEKRYVQCENLTKEHNWHYAGIECTAITGIILAINPGMEIYDIRKRCPGIIGHDCYDFRAAEAWLNSDKGKQMLNVPLNRNPDLTRETPDGVMAAWDGDQMTSFVDYVKELLDYGGRVVVYSGDYDFICNWVGGENWTMAMDWHGKSSFVNSEYHTWKSPDGSVAGFVKSTPDLQFQFIKVHNSGHLVPLDQPKNSLQMFASFLKNISLF